MFFKFVFIIVLHALSICSVRLLRVTLNINQSINQYMLVRNYPLTHAHEETVRSDLDLLPLAQCGVFRSAQKVANKGTGAALCLYIMETKCSANTGSMLKSVTAS